MHQFLNHRINIIYNSLMKDDLTILSAGSISYTQLFYKIYKPLSQNGIKRDFSNIIFQSKKNQRHKIVITLNTFLSIA